MRVVLAIRGVGPAALVGRVVLLVAGFVYLLCGELLNQVGLGSSCMSHGVIHIYL
jgi:hypothetical protein